MDALVTCLSGQAILSGIARIYFPLSYFVFSGDVGVGYAFFLKKIFLVYKGVVDLFRCLSNFQGL